jgi:hypothetical protein
MMDDSMLRSIDICYGSWGPSGKTHNQQDHDECGTNFQGCAPGSWPRFNTLHHEEPKFEQLWPVLEVRGRLGWRRAIE